MFAGFLSCLLSLLTPVHSWKLRSSMSSLVMAPLTIRLPECPIDGMLSCVTLCFPSTKRPDGYKPRVFLPYTTRERIATVVGARATTARSRLSQLQNAGRRGKSGRSGASPTADSTSRRMKWPRSKREGRNSEGTRDPKAFPGWPRSRWVPTSSRTCIPSYEPRSHMYTHTP